METYNYEWQTAKEIYEHRCDKKFFKHWGKASLNDMIGEQSLEQYEKAHELWLKLKDAFNKEAKTYKPNSYNSKLGSVGQVEEREVLRSQWWEYLKGNTYGNYGILTLIIEILHHGEQLKTGKILFGS